MKVIIKTDLIYLELEDTPTVTSDNYIKHALPSITDAVKSSVEQAIILHNEVKKK